MQYNSLYKKKLIFLLSFIFFTINGSKFSKQNTTITDVSKLTKTTVTAIKTPATINELRTLIRSTKKPLSIAGGRFSQGGQIAYPGAIVIDMTKFNHIKKFDPENKRITIETGTTWRDIQEHIDPHNLSVKTMQSYNDFTIGGSLSVNVHGRDINHGQLIETVESITVLNAEGSLITASRTKNQELFSAAIGGYGLVGVIVEATLSLTDNKKLEKKTQELAVDQYPAFFSKNIYHNSNAILHNANLYPNDLKKIISVTWCKTDKELTNTNRLQNSKNFYPTQQLGEQFVRRIPGYKKIRYAIDHKNFPTKEVVWQNYEMSYSVKTLEPLTRFPSTTILQEYFIPCDKFHHFVDKLRTTIKKHNINIINVSIRHVPKNNESLLTYAPQESFAFVLYINIWNTGSGKRHAQQWTQKLIDHALSLSGIYYLPYQLYATPEQLHSSYPNLDRFLELKKKYDPNNRFVNKLFEHYRLA